MKRVFAIFVAVLAVSAAGRIAAAGDDARGDDSVRTFATLPDGLKYPEGIAANPANGDIYVGTFNGGNVNRVLRYARDGRLLAQRDFGPTPLLGLQFDPAHNKLYVANVGAFVGGASKVQRVAASLDGGSAIEDVATLPWVGPPTQRVVGNPDGSADTITFGAYVAVPNAMALDGNGSLYVSDSFQGAIFRIDNPSGCGSACVAQTISHDPLLATTGFPAFGANGLAIGDAGASLFIANTGDDRVLKLDLTRPPLSEGAVTVFAENINGADGLAFDGQGRLWVAANQNDEMVALNAHGRVVERRGAFKGIRADGSPRGLLFPASPVIVGHHLFVTNLALPLTGTAGDEPEEDVTRWTVSRISLTD